MKEHREQKELKQEEEDEQKEQRWTRSIGSRGSKRSNSAGFLPQTAGAKRANGGDEGKGAIHAEGSTGVKREERSKRG